MAGAASIWQPGARLRFPVFTDLTAGISLGRAGRLFHIVSDPQSEPDIAFYDFWLTAGAGGVPVPVVDHATADLDFAPGALVGSGVWIPLPCARAGGAAAVRGSERRDIQPISIGPSLVLWKR